MINTFWIRLSSLGVRPDEYDLYKKSRIIITNQIAIVFLFTALVRLSLNLWRGDYDISLVTFLFILLLGITLLLNSFTWFLIARTYLSALFILAPYLMILQTDKLDLGTYIGFYFIQINSLIVFLLTFDKLFDRPVLYNIILMIVIVNILFHDIFYRVMLDSNHDLVPMIYGDNYVYIKLPQLTVCLVLIFGLRLWKQNFHKYTLSLEGLNNEVVEKNCKIEAQNEELKSQADQLGLQNSLLSKATEEIQEANLNLEGLVEQRTNQIQEQNRKLIDYAYFNSHKVRGPLARVLGLLHLMKVTDSHEQESLLTLLNESAQELDGMIREVNVILDSDLPDILKKRT